MADRYRRSSPSPSTGRGGGDDMDVDVEPPRKRFRWESQAAQLKAIRGVDGHKQRRRAALALTAEHRQQEAAQANGAAAGGGQGDAEEGDEDEEALLRTTPISIALDDLALDHLTARYVALASRLRPLVRTLPLALLNIHETFVAFDEFLGGVKVKLGGSSASNEASGRDAGLEGGLVLVERWVESVREEIVKVRVDVRVDQDEYHGKTTKRANRKKTEEHDDENDDDDNDAVLMAEVMEAADAAGLDIGVDDDDNDDAATDAMDDTPIAAPHRTINRSIFASLCAALLRVGALQGLEPSLVEKTYGCLAGVVRVVAGEVLAADADAIASVTAPAATTPTTAVVVVTPLDELLAVSRPHLSRSAKPHVRACVADVLAGLLRRARGQAARRLVKALLLRGGGERSNNDDDDDDDDDDDQDNSDDMGIALVLSAAAKGQGQGLHSRAAGIFSEVLAACSGLDDNDRTLRVARWFTTVLIHHSSSTAMQPLHELVLVQMESGAGVQSSSSILRIASVLLAVRKGQRVPAGFVQRYLRALADPKMMGRLADADATWRTEYIRAVVAGLVAGKLADWLSPGVRLIDELWANLTPTHAFSMVSSLVRLRWKGVEQFLLPHVARVSVESLPDPSLTPTTMAVLADLADNGFLNSGLANVQGGKWKDALARQLGALFDRWVEGDGGLPAADGPTRQAAIYAFTLTVKLQRSSLLFVEPLGRLVRALLEAGRNVSLAEAQAEFARNSLSLGHLIGSLLNVLAELESVPTATQDLPLDGLASKWFWNREVMRGLASLRDGQSVSDGDRESIQLCLLSEDSVLRESALSLLSPSHATFEQCLAIERSEISLRNVRERTTQIRKLGLMLEESLPDDWIIDSLVRYLLSQFKVNFRPLYSETIAVLSGIAAKKPDLLWAIVEHELELTKTNEVGRLLLVPQPTWVDDVAADKKATSAAATDEKSFICPNAIKLDDAVEGKAAANLDDKCQQYPDERLDVLNYESQLLEFLTQNASLAEKHSRQIIPSFLELVRSSDGQTELSVRVVHSKLANYLKLLGHFTNPKAIYKTQQAHASYLTVLSMGDSNLQGLALTCINTYKSSAILPYEPRLRGLLKDSTFRDTLTNLNLSVSGQDIEPQHRPEFMAVVSRILFGIMTARRGRSSSSQAAARKHAVLASLSGVKPDELCTLVEMMLVPFPSMEIGEKPSATPKQQVGFLTTLGDVLKHLAVQIEPLWPKLLMTTLHIVAFAQQQIDGDSNSTLPVRNLRAMGLRRLADFAAAPAEFDFTPYLQAMFTFIITPRLAQLPQENTQSPSALMDIFSAWSQRPERARFLSAYDDRVLPQFFGCLAQPKVKPAVVVHVLDTADRLLKLEAELPVQSLIDNLVAYAGSAVSRSNIGRDEVLKRVISVLSSIVSHVTTSSQAAQIVSLLLPLLRRPTKQVNEKTKSEILLAVEVLIVKVDDFKSPDSTFFRHAYGVVSTLFRSYQTRQARQGLVAVLERFGAVDETLSVSIGLISDLNAFSVRRIDEPDFDRRLGAFATLDAGLWSQLSTWQWLPLVHNLLFLLQDPEELTIRTNAAQGLKRFIDSCKDQERNDLLIAGVYPGLRQIIRSRHELVRSEALGVIASAVKTSDIETFSELRPLLADGDEEANFFNNVYHLQIHRRVRAIRRLEEFCSERPVRDNTIFGVFIPILSHIVAGSVEKTDHTLINAAIQAIGRLSSSLRWSRYNATLMDYIRLGKVKGPQQKHFVRTVSSILDNFHYMGEKKLVVSQTAEEGAADEDEPEMEVSDESFKVVDYVTKRLLPSLNSFVEQKEETEDTIRIPVAVGIIKVAMTLPADIRHGEVTKTLAILSQILRSKDQDVRDLVRDTMAKVALTLGPDWLTTVIKELRTALARGPQLHVLAVTVHRILVHVTTEVTTEFASLDGPVADIVHVAAEVIWGQSGQDTQMEGFKSKMREVKAATSRGYDCFQLVSRLVSPVKISQILLPVRNIMEETRAVALMLKVDEVLRRIANGLNANPRMDSTQMLRLCHTLIKSNADFLQVKKPIAAVDAKNDYVVQMKRNREQSESCYSENAFRFVALGLDLFVTAFRRGKFDFGDVEVLSRLSPMVNAIGNTLYSTSALVLAIALKAIAAVLKCPLPTAEPALPQVVRQIIAIIKRLGGSAESETAQAAIKALAVIIRDCKADLTEKQVVYLLELIGPEIEEHERQVPAFALLRAIISRRFVAAEIYDLMEKVSSVMVTSQSTHVQELCRSTLIQFLLDYPQGKGRLKSQLTFLAQNLSYVYESGRVSVMELLSACFSKFSEHLLREQFDLFFVALILVLVNDESEKCRTMAGELIKQLLAQQDEEKISSVIQMLTKWIDHRDQDRTMARAGVLASGLLVQAVPAHAQQVLDVVSTLISEAAADLETAEADESAFANDALDYALPFSALATAQHCLDVGEGSSVSWQDLSTLLLFPHDWVRLSAAKLLAMDASSISVEGLQEVARKACLVLTGTAGEDGARNPPSEKLCGQIAKILYIAGKAFAADGEAIVTEEAHDDDEPSTATQQVKTSGGLSWLMSRLSFIARNLIINRPPAHQQLRAPIKWSHPLCTNLQVMGALVDHLDVERAERYLKHVLNPVYRISDDEGDVKVIEGDRETERLREIAIEVREMVQAKVGSTAFSREWELLRRKTVEKRMKRKTDGQQMAVMDPEAWAARKEQRGTMKKESKKRKTKAFADAKLRERPMKRRAN